MTRPRDMTWESLEGVSVIPPAPEESPVAQSDVNIGLRNDQIFQRYLVRRIFREVEFRIVETDGTEHVGYITGFDDRCIQMSITPLTDIDAPRAVLVFWPLRRIEETGGKVDDLPSDQRQAIRSYSHALRAQCEKTLAQQGNTAGQNGNRRAEQRNGTSPAFSDGL
ncbi:hypothetical protein MYRNA_184 [Mycobacterium phage Myrna]|uniref:Hfq-like domain-containing protein n=1 Tax=Mycobacterium phage Myrna TaxID=546805 RepID=B5LJF6_9CAUD|nr:gp184 [Mycobacterium phage Myrna]ACH62153.1 hypothetical protein MYRNA_184 [Mycobacterium phage Myrna]